MSPFRGPVPIAQAHAIEGFDCGDEDLNLWLLGRAQPNQRSGNSRTWVVVDDVDRVVGFYASSTAVVAHYEASGRIRRNSPDPIPAVLLGRLAVDSKVQRAGLGQALLKHFILKALDVAELVGVRVLLAHAANESLVGLYGKFGFEPSPVHPLKMMLLVQDITVSR